MIPTITNISPGTIYTGGQGITITGTGFRTAYPIDPATPHPWATPSPTVAVTVAGRPATKIKVLSATSITCLVASANPGAATVTVQNLTVDGAPITGETVSTATRLAFARADLTVSSDLSRVVEALIDELKRQILDNVQLQESVDYDAADPDIETFVGVNIAALPQLLLSGPSLQINRFSGDLRPESTETDGTFSRRKSFAAYDLGFRLTGLDKHGRRSLNLQALVVQFFKNNLQLSVARDPSDLSKGYVQYDIESDGMDNTSINGSNDLRVFMGALTIRGFQFEDVAGAPRQTVVETGDTVDEIRVVAEPFAP